MTRLTRLTRRVRRRLRRPTHIGWGGDPRCPWTPTWEPDPKGAIR